MTEERRRSADEARWQAIAAWLMEVSALLMVFPALDLFLERMRGAAVDWLYAVGFLALAWVFLMVGLMLTRGD